MVEQIKNWWDGTTEREQQVTIFSVLVIFIAALYFLLWLPFANDLAANQARLKKTEQTLQWVETNATKLINAGVGGNKKSSRKKNLSQLINSTAKSNKIDISRIQNGKGKVDVWINKVEFDKFVKWTTALQNQYQVHIKSVDLTRDNEQGLIKVNRLSLSY